MNTETTRRQNLLFISLATLLMMIVPICIESPSSDATYDTTETFTITFHGNSGTASGDTTRVYTVHGGQDIYLPVTMFSREGYYLESWNLGSTGGTPYEPGEKYTVNEDARFYAEWIQVSGTYREDMSQVITESTMYDKSFVQGFNVWDTANYEFNGPEWLTLDYTADAFGDRTWHFTGRPGEAGLWYCHLHLSDLLSSQDYYWVITVPSQMDTQCTVSFDLNGGTATGGSGLIPKTNPAGTTITLYGGDDVSYSGHTLLGWRISIDGQAAIFPVNCEYTQNIDRQSITATAQWLASSYAIVYNPLNAPGVRGDTASYGDILVLDRDAGAGVNAPEGYHFGGWTIQGQDNVVLAPGMSIEVTGQIYLGGYWISDNADTHKVTFNANGGSGTLSTDVEAGDGVYLPQKGFERSGYIFAGWYTSSSGGTKVDGESFTPTKDTTLYAHWIQNIRPITDINLTGTSIVNVGSSITIQATATPSTADDRGVRFTIENGTGSARIESQNDTTTGGYATIVGISPGTVKLTAHSMDGSGVTKTKTITVLAAEDTHVFTLIYDANGGNGAPSPESTNAGTASSHEFTISRTVPTLDGHTFMGWAREGSSVPEFGFMDNLKTTITVYTDTTTLHAIWQENKSTFTLVYDANGGVWENISEEKYSISVGADTSSYEFTVISDHPDYLGYRFLGWSDEEIPAGEGTSDDVDHVAGDRINVSDSKTIHAVWGDNRCTYVLKFDSNGGTWPSGAAPTLSETTPATYWTFKIPTDSDSVPAMAGKSFIGWSINGSGIITEGETVYSPGDTVVFTGTPATTSEIILMAVWGDGKNSHILTFDGNGDEGDVIVNVPDADTQPTDSKGWSHFILPTEIPSRTGVDGTTFIFNGWDTDPNVLNGGYAVGNEVRSTEDFTLYAIWSVGGSMVSVTFFTNVTDTSVTGMPGNLTGQILDGSEVVDLTIPDTKPAREGYVFVGWSESPDSSRIYCSAGQTIPVSEDLDLFAVWKPIGTPSDTYTVIFDANGGTPVTSQEIVSGGYAERPEDPVRDGFTFKGWELDGRVFDFEGTPIDTDITLKAAWSDGSGGNQDSGDDDDDGGHAMGIMVMMSFAACLILLIVIVVRR